MCLGCVEPDAVIAALVRSVQEVEQWVRDLEVRLGQNASTSSVPPSSNPPGAKPPVVKKRSGRAIGGQLGHPGHRRQRLLADRIDHLIALVPSHSEGCHAALPQVNSDKDPESTWHQAAELPRVGVVVTEFRGHSRTCLMNDNYNARRVAFRFATWTHQRRSALSAMSSATAHPVASYP